MSMRLSFLFLFRTSCTGRSLALAVELLKLLEFFRALRVGLLAANEHGVPNVSLS